MLFPHQHRDIFIVNRFQRNKFLVNMFAIPLFTGQVNFKTHFTPASIIFVVLRNIHIIINQPLGKCFLLDSFTIGYFGYYVFQHRLVWQRKKNRGWQHHKLISLGSFLQFPGLFNNNIRDSSDDTISNITLTVTTYTVQSPSQHGWLYQSHWQSQKIDTLLGLTSGLWQFLAMHDCLIYLHWIGLCNCSLHWYFYLAPPSQFLHSHHQ